MRYLGFLFHQAWIKINQRQVIFEVMGAGLSNPIMHKSRHSIPDCINITRFCSYRMRMLAVLMVWFSWLNVWYSALKLENILCVMVKYLHWLKAIFGKLKYCFYSILFINVKSRNIFMKARYSKSIRICWFSYH